MILIVICKLAKCCKKMLVIFFWNDSMSLYIGHMHASICILHTKPKLDRVTELDTHEKISAQRTKNDGGYTNR